MVKKNLSILTAMLAVLTMTSCSHRLTDFTVISTKNVPIGNQPTDLVKGNQRVKGVDKTPMILCFPLGTPNLKEAIDKAIEKTPGAIALADGVVKSKYVNFFFYGYDSYIVEGTPLFPTDIPQNNYTQGNVYQQTGNTGTPPTTTERSVMKFTHEVNTEKNVSELAKMYDVSVPNIMKWNKLSKPTLSKGQKIIIYLED